LLTVDLQTQVSNYEHQVIGATVTHDASARPRGSEIVAVARTGALAAMGSHSTLLQPTVAQASAGALFPDDTKSTNSSTSSITMHVLCMTDFESMHSLSQLQPFPHQAVRLQCFAYGKCYFSCKEQIEVVRATIACFDDWIARSREHVHTYTCNVGTYTCDVDCTRFKFTYD